MATMFMLFMALGKIIGGLLLTCAGLLWLVNILFFISGCIIDGIPLAKWPLVARFVCITIIVGAGITGIIYGCMQLLYFFKTCIF